MNWLSCRNQPRAGRFYAENPISPPIPNEFGRRAISSGSCLGQERERTHVDPTCVRNRIAQSRVNTRMSRPRVSTVWAITYYQVEILIMVILAESAPQRFA